MYFIIFSTADEENNLNAIRSSNGGLTGIMFASLHEIIENEDVDKAVNPKTLKDYLAYRTGKNIIFCHTGFLLSISFSRQ